MKNNKGITLTSLMIYVIGMLIIIALISTLTTFFYKNIDVTAINDNTTTEYTKFSSNFLEEINQKDNRVIDARTYMEDEEKISYIIFSTGNQYTYKSNNKSIYKNNIKICQNVEECIFSYNLKDSQYTVNVKLKVGKMDKTGENVLLYTIKK